MTLASWKDKLLKNLAAEIHLSNRIRTNKSANSLSN